MGAYTSIVEIQAPSCAAAGSMVNVVVKIRNLYSADIHIYCIGVLDSQGRFIDWQDAWVGAGQTQSFSGSFTMPGQDVTLNIYSYYESAVGAERDESRSTTVAVYTGSLSRLELEYDSERAAIPAPGIPQGRSGLLHIWGRNNMSTAQRMGIYWIVRDPDGITVEEYSTWEAWPYTAPGNEHEFIGGRFGLNKPGLYTIWCALMMNAESPLYVDFYDGALCPVMAAQPVISEFRILDYQKV